MPDWSLEAIYDRLEENAPRIAIIGGSPDHPAHIMDPGTGARAALAIWKHGGVPVLVFRAGALRRHRPEQHGHELLACRAATRSPRWSSTRWRRTATTARSSSRAATRCRWPSVSALAHLDTLRRLRGEAPVFAAFAPAHVLKGGVDSGRCAAWSSSCSRPSAAPPGTPRSPRTSRTRCSTSCSAPRTPHSRASSSARSRPACSSDERHKELEKGLAVNTCDAKGGICAFNGTGNSSRHLVAAMGLVHPAVELLTDPPTTEQVEAVGRRPLHVGRAAGMRGRQLVIAEHGQRGPHAQRLRRLDQSADAPGRRGDLRRLPVLDLGPRPDPPRHPVPDLFDYSLTQGRDIFALAKQCCSGDIRGMETLIYEMVHNGVPMDLDAMTVTGTTWRERLSDTTNLSADGVRDNPVILAKPRRAVSGVDVLQSNWFESAVVKISGMPERQVNFFDEQVGCRRSSSKPRKPPTKRCSTSTCSITARRARRLPRPICARCGATMRAPERQRRTRHRRLPTPLESTRRMSWIMTTSSTYGQDRHAQNRDRDRLAGSGSVWHAGDVHADAAHQCQPLVAQAGDARSATAATPASATARRSGTSRPRRRAAARSSACKTGDLLHLRFRARRVDLIDPAAFRAGQIEFAGHRDSWPAAMQLPASAWRG